LQTDEDYTNFSERKVCLFVSFSLCENARPLSHFFFFFLQSLTLAMGSTGVVCLGVNGHMYISWVGDSEACLVKKSQDVLKFVECHKPKFESERLRIEEKGGFVTELNGVYRVNGALAVSRAFGDIRLKAAVTAEPDTSTYKLQGEENYMVVACDGLWDVVSPFDIEEFVDNYVNSEGSIEGVTGALKAMARQRHSTDNITILYVQFQN